MRRFVTCFTCCACEISSVPVGYSHKLSITSETLRSIILSLIQTLHDTINIKSSPSKALLN
jgi:hypothetical protein